MEKAAKNMLLKTSKSLTIKQLVNILHYRQHIL